MDLSHRHHLPILDKRDDIIDAITGNPVIIVAGETGSGKTTQLPQFCRTLLDEKEGMIGCTQPRRIAALTVASRVSEELGENGCEVGHKIRFSDATNQHTRIKFMTDGVLLAEIKNDPFLRMYRYLIIDEAHERSLNIDFLLGHLRNLLAHRSDLKVIITSATIDTEAFSRHFYDAPVLQIPGKTYPIETRYLPLAVDEHGEPENYIDGVVKCTVNIVKKGPPGDILIFLPTEKDIHNCTKILNHKVTNSTTLPLFGRLHTTDQKKIFQPSNRTKIVVATNVAETSITVPGIRHVIDTGLARISQYNFRAKTNGLPIKKIGTVKL